MGNAYSENRLTPRALSDNEENNVIVMTMLFVTSLAQVLRCCVRRAGDNEPLSVGVFSHLGAQDALVALCAATTSSSQSRCF